MLLESMQKRFPLVNRPFAAIADKLGMKEDEVLSRVKNLKKRGIINRIYAIAAREKLGIKRSSTLIGINVPPEKLDEVAKKVNEFGNITHNCARTHPRYNLWYVIEGPDEEFLRETNEKISKATGITDTVDLPGLKLFKINVRYDLSKT